MTLSGGPLGIFDSGVGGLTVVGEVLRRFPNEQVLYVADQVHVPYGGRPLNEIEQFATGISSFLASEGCRAILMACNISSAVALSKVRHTLAPTPVFGMIEAAAKRVAADSERAVGVLATAGTVKSGAYTAHILTHSPDTTVIEVACPKLVPLVESGETNSVEVDDAVREYLVPLARAECRTIVLGCTHYPFLLPALRRAAGELWDRPPVFIDPASELIDQVSERLDLGLSLGGQSLFLTTGERRAFERQAPVFVPGIEAEIGGACWEANCLTRSETVAWRL